MLTRLQANSAQSTNVATFSGVNFAGRSVIDKPSEVRIPSWLLATWSSEVSDFSISKLKKKT